MEKRKLAVLALGALGLAGALTAAALVAPARALDAAPTYVPADPARVVAHVPARGRQVAAGLDARRDRAERAVADGEWAAAAADLDVVLAARPDDVRGQLARARVAMARADEAGARASCAVIARVAPAIVAATCVAPVDGLAHPEAAEAALAAALTAAGPVDDGVRGRVLLALGELAAQRGDDPTALARAGAALALAPGDDPARAAVADALLRVDRAGDASALLAGHEASPGLLVRRAIAEHLARGPRADELAAVARTARAPRPLQVRFALAVEGDAARALTLATGAWAAAQDLPTARALAEAAGEARTPAAAEPVRAWRAAHHVVDAPLDRAIGALGAAP